MTANPPSSPPPIPASVAVVWRPSVRVIAARYAAVPYLEVAASPADAELNLALARLTDGTATAMHDAYRRLPNEDRLSGPGSGLLMPSWLYPANPGRFSTGAGGGTYYAAGDEATGVAETTYHFAVEVERSPAALAAALAAGTPPRRAVQIVLADVLGVFADVRADRADPGWGDLYDSTDYAPGQRLERAVRGGGSGGIALDGVVYESVRRRPAYGECVAVYRPRALRDGRVGGKLTYAWRSPGRVEVR